MTDLDLFGNEIPEPAKPTSDRSPINDMDLVETILAAATNHGYHLAGSGEKVSRCAGAKVDPVPGYEDIAVHQLIDARYLEVISHRWCPFTGERVDGHGRTVRLSKRGRDALNRWKAYKRPTTWSAHRVAGAS